MISNKLLVFFAVFALVLPNSSAFDHFASPLRRCGFLLNFACFQIASTPMLQVSNSMLILQLENSNSSESWDNITIAIIAAAGTIVGTFVGYILTARITTQTEKRRFGKSILKGIRNLAAELERNEELLKASLEAEMDIWSLSKRKFWLMSPLVGKKCKENLKQVYSLLSNYNKEVYVAKTLEPENQKERVQAFISEHDLLRKVQEAYTELEDIETKALRDLFK